MNQKHVISILSILLGVATVFAVWPFFGAPWVGSTNVTVATPEEKCKEAKLALQQFEDSTFREKAIEAEVAISQAFRYGMSDEELRQAEETRYESNLSWNEAEAEYWCTG